MKRRKPKLSSVKAKPKKKTPTKTTLRNKADKLCRKWFHAAERCEARKVKGVECGGNLEWCHLVSRSVGIIRHHPLNAVPMCSAHHRYFTQRPLEFWEFIEERFPGRSQLLKDLERGMRAEGQKPDYEGWIAWYTDRMDNFKTWDGEL